MAHFFGHPVYVAYPSDKYIIHKYCSGEVTIQFQDIEFFHKVKNSLIDHYPILSRQMTSIHGLQYITDQSGHEVSLQISDEAYSVFANDDGALSWTMRDFQSICRSLAINAGLKTHEKIIVSIVFRRMCATQRLTGSSNRRPWLIRQTGPMSSGVTKNSGAHANNLSEESPSSLLAMGLCPLLLQHLPWRPTWPAE